MDRYRYFIFNQRNMVVLGMFQIALSTVCVVSGFIDGIFRTESQLGKTRAPVWAGMVNVLIVASIISCVAILIVIGYSSFTLNYGEEEELSSSPVHVFHTRFILNKVVKGANIAMLAASICSAFFVLAMAYLGCRSLPRCSCYDSVTGMVSELSSIYLACQALGMKWEMTHPIMQIYTAFEQDLEIIWLVQFLTCDPGLLVLSVRATFAGNESLSPLLAKGSEKSEDKKSHISALP
ncbi:hypothetical protein WISP_95219 [Willisornis vidua]|uniref:Uncharacterized protein n=1 Tax=Willisornis vidua TaxID=1566151 RepID=A0ABQ9D5E9_9PASS|nr:hypothetical protein WISP_95219 [Willisornis vidua]